MNKRNTRQLSRSTAVRYWLPVLLHMALIFYLSSRSSFPVEVPPWAFFADKVVHMILFGLLGFLFLRAWLRAEWKNYNWKAGITTIAFVALYGVTDEVHQMYVPGRTPSSSDLIADVFGGMAIVGLIYSYAQMRTRALKKL